MILRKRAEPMRWWRDMRLERTGAVKVLPQQNSSSPVRQRARG
jgi:hypothetical protein